MVLTQGIKDAYTCGVETQAKPVQPRVEDYMSPPEVKSVNTSAYTGIAGEHDHGSSRGRLPRNRCSGGNLLLQMVHCWKKAMPYNRPMDWTWTYTATQANAAMTGS